MGVKSTVGVEISTKLWETVFEEISKVVAGPRDPADALAELPELDAGKDADDEIVGEFDDDGVEDDLPRIQEQRESESADVIDVEIVDAGYTDAPMTIGSGTAHTGHVRFSAPRAAQPRSGLPRSSRTHRPAGSGMLSLQDAVAAQADMVRRANIRNARRR